MVLAYRGFGVFRFGVVLNEILRLLGVRAAD